MQLPEQMSLVPAHHSIFSADMYVVLPPFQNKCNSRTKHANQ